VSAHNHQDQMPANWFNVLKYQEGHGFQGTEAHVAGFEEAQHIAEYAARNAALRGRAGFEYRVYDRDGRCFYRAPRSVVEPD
jgi:hypothetical protein